MQPSLKIFVFYGILIFVIKSNFLAAMNLYTAKICLLCRNERIKTCIVSLLWRTKVKLRNPFKRYWNNGGYKSIVPHILTIS